MASVWGGNAVGEGAGIRRPRLRVSFDRLAGTERAGDWWEEPEYEGVYVLASVNDRRLPFFWHRGDHPGRPEWLLSGRCYLRADRGWVVRLSSGHILARAGESHVTLLQGTWAPASGGRLAVRSADGAAAAWRADGREVVIRGVLTPPRTFEDVVAATLRFTKVR